MDSDLKPMKKALLKCRSLYMQELRTATGVRWGALSEVREFGTTRLHMGFTYDKGSMRYLLHTEITYKPLHRRFDFETHLSQGGFPLTEQFCFESLGPMDLVQPRVTLAKVMPLVVAILRDKSWT